jgi:hypothetical protein
MCEEYSAKMKKLQDGEQIFPLLSEERVRVRGN